MLKTSESRINAEISRLPAAYCRPPTNCCHGDVVFWVLSRGGNFISHNPMMTARKEMPLSVKHHAAPITASISPATAGPMIRALLNIIEFSAIALGRSFLPTNSGTSAWRPGASKALTTPNSAESTITCHSCITPAKVNAASANASSMDPVWVMINRLRRETRSTTTPPHGEITSVGIADAKATRPSANSEWLI